MSFKSIVYNVMISSPSDVINEKTITKEVIYEFNTLFASKNKIVLLPKSWETHSFPVQGDRPQELINKQVLIDSDILVAIFWTRIGTPTGKADSGSIEEIEEHIYQGKPALLYFSSFPVDPRSIDQDQYSKLTEYKEKCKKRGLYQEYDDYTNFRELFRRNLIHLVQNHEYFRDDISELIENESSEQKSNSDDDRIIASLSNESKFFLKEASKSRNGNIMVLKVMGGPVYQVNGKGYQVKNNRREEAILEQAIEILESNNLIEATSYKREVFKVTAKGFEIADKLPDEKSIE